MSVDTQIRDSQPTRVERWGTIIIGAGRSGIALGRLLLSRDVDFVILERLHSGRRSRIATRFDLPLRMSSEVTALRWDGAHYVLDSRELTYEAAQVVVATGSRMSDWGWIQLALPRVNGEPRTICGCVPTHHGLYFVGRCVRGEPGVSSPGMRELQHRLIAECIASDHAQPT
jgi:hypothetical protein